MITAIKTTPPTVTPQIRPTKILMITAIKTRPPNCNTTNKTYKKY